jgi:hypothetical protein
VEKEIARLIKAYDVEYVKLKKQPLKFRVAQDLLDEINFLKSLKLQEAGLDAVAFTRKAASGKKELLVSFRGTAKLRDLIPDWQILTNSKKMKRMDEALAFTKRMQKVTGVRPGGMTMYGHR